MQKAKEAAHIREERMKQATFWGKGVLRRRATVGLGSIQVAQLSSLEDVRTLVGEDSAFYEECVMYSVKIQVIKMDRPFRPALKGGCKKVVQEDLEIAHEGPGEEAWLGWRFRGESLGRRQQERGEEERRGEVQSSR